MEVQVKISKRCDLSQCAHTYHLSCDKTFHVCSPFQIYGGSTALQINFDSVPAPAEYDAEKYVCLILGICDVGERLIIPCPNRILKAEWLKYHNSSAFSFGPPQESKMASTYKSAGLKVPDDKRDFAKTSSTMALTFPGPGSYAKIGCMGEQKESTRCSTPNPKFSKGTRNPKGLYNGVGMESVSSIISVADSQGEGEGEEETWVYSGIAKQASSKMRSSAAFSFGSGRSRDNRPNTSPYPSLAHSHSVSHMSKPNSKKVTKDNYEWLHPELHRRSVMCLAFQSK